MRTILACVVFWSFSIVKRDQQVTWYYEPGGITASGAPYRGDVMACAVKDRNDIRHWFVVSYGGNSVRVKANDLMHYNAKADIDLTPAAFMKLAPLKEGRLHGATIRRDD